MLFCNAAGEPAFHDSTRASTAQISETSQPIGYGRMNSPHHSECPLLPPMPPHSLSTIIDADKICYLDAGKIVEIGTSEELMKKDGAFAQLARRQMA